MALNYRTPGVYIEEHSNGLRPMEPAGTSTFGVVGTAPVVDAHLNVPTPILDFSHFKREFATAADGTVVARTTPLVAAVMGFFSNGGTLCYVVNVGDTGDDPVPGLPGTGVGVDALGLIDDIAIVAIPGYTDAVSYDTVLTHCENRQDRVAILDGPGPEEFPTDTSLLINTAEIRRGRPPLPPARPPGDDDESDAESDADDDRIGGGPGRGSPPAGPPPAGAAPAGYKPRASQRGFGAVYVPWICVLDPFDQKTIIEVPPSGHLAGVWARTDAEHGVHRAPANTQLRGTAALTRHITAAEQAILNPAGVNCIRHFTSDGTLVWGARTLASDPEWRYINVRRLFCMIEQTILANTRWAVFQPNTKPLWKSIERTVTAFLLRVWRSGALSGTTPEQAFFVQCNSETNPPEIRDAGMVVTVIGIAPAKPAEFVVFQVAQHNEGAETVTEGAS